MNNVFYTLADFYEAKYKWVIAKNNFIIFAFWSYIGDFFWSALKLEKKQI